MDSLLLTMDSLRDSEENFGELIDWKKTSKRERKSKNTRLTSSKLFLSKPQTPSNKKTDRLQLFLNRKQEWDSQAFLKHNSLSTKGGRKLNLADSHRMRQTFQITSRPRSHNSSTLNFVPPHQKRRDDIRSSIRSKMQKLSFS